MPICGSAKISSFVQGNGPFDQLRPQQKLAWRYIVALTSSPITEGIGEITGSVAFLVPGQTRLLF
nr:uncharacterized protein CTRU02_02469 [Colletotrichum truncatum]KAF6798495.1 hypothetical protein CTRU02_02469 [Colletotrichum truncatum]